MLRSLLRSLDSYAAVNPFTWVYGLGRSLLALGTLITFLFSSSTVLFDQRSFGSHSLVPHLDYFNLFFLLGYDHIPYASMIVVIVLLLVISGVYPRFTGTLHWLVTYSFYQACSLVEGGDQLGSVLTLLLIPVTLLDSRANHWHQAAAQETPSYYKNFVAHLALGLMAVQMAAVYFHAGIDKLYKLEEWRNGTAVYYFFSDPLLGYPEWMHGFMAPTLAHTYGVTALTWGTLLLEIILFAALFMSARNRRRLLLPALGFHLGIALVLGLVSFFLAMAGGLILYALPVQTPFPSRKKRKTPAEPSLSFATYEPHYAALAATGPSFTSPVGYAPR